MKKTILSIAFLPFLFSCSNSNSETEEQSILLSEAKNAVAVIDAKSGSKTTGKVDFMESDGMVKITAKIEGLTPGSHAIHIHEKGDCSAADGKSAGGHWNPTNKAHGKWGISPFHVGDIGNLEVGEDSIGTLSLKTDKWCISCNDANKDITGKAIIIHEGPDDFSSQPSGAAGPRIGCGEIVESTVI
ncbi:superoxide dismutase family protein [Arcticibacterium luteifluviistationis]|uniref:Superoxide dismutase n=1 Tax=Arcticibacterium luteifluviistationis TaxID=1784714 RepID=A0A2Z4G9H7_9BACT|nr:superoxide dismutase family protein [Arcticibacterium luteifluviistationis]AWV97718.1 superoxide dismutase [Arcticibacterium luteifluviistationis]